MPRRARMYLPDIPAHIVQRGNNREPCFFHTDDYRYYLQCLNEALNRYKVRCHAYVLMTNHVHLLMSPVDLTGISRAMSLLGKNYVLYINKTYRRTGTLWEGRHKSSLVSAEDYLFRCYRYIEMNPVRAGMVKNPGEYLWSSYRYNAHGEINSVIKPHELYLLLGNTFEERNYAYRELFRVDLHDEDIHQIRQSVDQNYPLGNNRFTKLIEKTLNRSVGQEQRGRPRKYQSD